MAALIRDRYEPVAVAGRGGQGEVLKAIDRLHGRTVAIKVRRVAGDSEPILREGSVLLALPAHPSLPVVREDFLEGDRYHLVMDWVEGRSLHDVLAERGRLPVDEVLGWLRQVASALDHLHGADPAVVHGDVKPGNVIVSRDRAVLVDFGLAGTPVAGSGPARGTPGYIAPELVAGERASPACDVFGLAATAFALLAGGPPVYGAVPDWGDVSAERAKLLDRALHRGLALDPSRRPYSASEMVAAMEREPAVPNNLPLEISSLVGRENVLDEIRKLLPQARLVTLSGAGGIGKTRLAVRVAGEMLDQFADGCWLIELAALQDASLLPGALAAALGLREEPRRTPWETLAGHLATRDVLLIFDNCEHLVEGCAELTERVLRACRGVSILATSREPLRIPGEAVFRVPSLTLPDPDASPSPEALMRTEAVRLFVERASLALPGFRLAPEAGQAVATICRRLDGIPLAIELAAAQTKSLPPEQIAARLDDLFWQLTGGSRTALPRHQTLRAAMDWSYELLGAEERRVLAELSVFAGGFSLEAAEAVSGAGVLPVLSQLVDKSLLAAEPQRAEARYRMLETVRAYAREKLDGDEAGARERHLAWFAALAARAGEASYGPEEGAWLDRLERDHDNLRSALEWSERAGRAEEGLELAVRLWRFWRLRGYLTEGRRRLEALVAIAEPPPALRARALLSAGALARGQGDYQAARTLIEESLEINRALDDRGGIARSLNFLGNIACLQGDYPRARSFYDESLVIHRALGDRRGVVEALTNLGVVAMDVGDNAVAATLLSESLDESRALGDRDAIAATLSNLGVVAENRGDHERARAHYEESLAIRRELGDPWGIANSLGNLAGLARERGDYGAAASLFAEALALQRELGDRDGIGHSLHGLGRVAMLTGALDRAVTLLREALALRRDLHDQPGIAECLEGLAAAAAAGGDAERAAWLAGAAEAIREAAGSPLPPAPREALASVLAAARAALGSEDFGGRARAGRAAGLERAVAMGLGDADPAA